MTRAKIKKRKRKLKTGAVASALFVFSMFMFIPVRFWVKSVNYSLSIELQQLNVKKDELKQAVSGLTQEVANLKSKDRVVAIAGEEYAMIEQNINVIEAED